MALIGFIVNPIAGMGGRVGLKGTDGVLKEALELGAEPVAPQRVEVFLRRLDSIIESRGIEKRIEWLTCSDGMGEDSLRSFASDYWEYEVDCESSAPTTAEDTKNACKILLGKNVSLIVFCGGDGTARDIWQTVGEDVPIIGIPSGVKMHSGVFGMNPEATAEIVAEFISGEMDVAEGEILDLDEEKYRKGEWHIQLFGTAKTPHEPTYVQVSKVQVEAVGEDAIKEEIAESIVEDMEDEPDTLFILGSGSTVGAVSQELGIEFSLLGVDTVVNKELIAKDVNESKLLSLLDQYPKVRLVISPIGAQGFILGRGNLQLSPEVIRRIGIDNITVISPPAKLAQTPVLRVDTGDKELDEMFYERQYLRVVFRYKTMKLVKVGK
ncbi:MAG: ATP-NAD kinase family protein [Methanobacteriota archaeon]|nr:MAG: ATP-NAD kinase family protein [Euryarchaeota archaeon]